MKTAPNWPASLPQHVSRPRYGETPIAPRNDFQPDAGPPIESPRSTIRMAELDCALTMTRDQLDTFEEFAWRDLAQGTAFFYFPHPRSRAQIKVKMASNGGQPWAIKAISSMEFEVTFKLLAVGL